MIRRDRRATRPSVECLDGRILLSGVTPFQLEHAYGFDSFNFVANGKTVKPDGTGQTIAIVDAYHDPYLSSDLHNFDRSYGLPDPSLTVYGFSGTPSNDGWAEEEVLDVEYAHAIAPGAKIVVIEAKNPSDLFNEVNFAKNLPGVSVVSMSFGSSEFSGQKGQDSLFTTPAGHTGVTFLAATGDAGAYSGVSYPSSSPNVVAVGGTTLNVASNGTYLSESAWSGSGGGYSRYEAEPSYQRSVQSSGLRTTPDVSLDADPNTGATLYYTTPSTGRGGFTIVGGTSASTPEFAGLVAIADQGRALIGKNPLDGATQTLPQLYASPSSDFHDITTGSNGYRATVGYDLATGRGTPNALPLIVDLTRPASRPVLSYTVGASLSLANASPFTASLVGSFDVSTAPGDSTTDTTEAAKPTTPSPTPALAIAPPTDLLGSPTIATGHTSPKAGTPHDQALANVAQDVEIDWFV